MIAIATIATLLIATTCADAVAISTATACAAPFNAAPTKDTDCGIKEVDNCCYVEYKKAADSTATKKCINVSTITAGADAAAFATNIKNAYTELADSANAPVAKCTYQTTLPSAKNECGSKTTVATADKAYDCHTSVGDKCCYVPFKDTAKKAVCVDVSKAHSSYTTADNFVKYIQSAYTDEIEDATKIVCGATLGTAALKTDANTCGVSLTEKPTAVDKCAASSLERCCFVTTSGSAAVNVCTDVKSISSSGANSDAQKAAVIAAYSNVAKVDCGADVTKVVLSASTCKTDVKTPAKEADCNAGAKDKCCFVQTTGTSPVGYCVAPTDAGKNLSKSSDLKYFINNYYSNIVVDNTACGSDTTAPVQTALPSASDCNTTKLGTNTPSKVGDCNTFISDKCCYVTSTVANSKGLCLDPTKAGATTTDEYVTKIKAFYKEVNGVECGVAAKPVSENTCPAAKTATDKKSVEAAAASDCNTYSGSNCCFTTSNAGKKFCLTPSTSAKTSAEQKANILATYDAKDADCGADAISKTTTGKEFPDKNSCNTSATFKEADKAADAKSCVTKVSDKCCYVKKIDGATAFCLDVKAATDKTTSADLVSYIANNYKDVLSADCGTDATTGTATSISKDIATETFPTTSTCSAADASKAPATLTQATDCNANSKNKCCYAKSTDATPVVACIKVAKDKALNQTEEVVSKYKNVAEVKCGDDVAETFPTASDCSSNLKVLPDKKEKCYSGNVKTDRCCFARDVKDYNKTACIKIGGNLTAANALAGIKEKYGANVNATSIDCSSGFISASIIALIAALFALF